eukprot:6320487-Pyramimonas_sp.AAC.1
MGKHRQPRGPALEPRNPAKKLRSLAQILRGPGREPRSLDQLTEIAHLRPLLLRDGAFSRGFLHAALSPGLSHAFDLPSARRHDLNRPEHDATAVASVGNLRHAM